MATVQFETELVMSSSLHGNPQSDAIPALNLAIDNTAIDNEGYALIESYIWDIGEDEETERLIDKAIRILLIHPEFGSNSFSNQFQ